MIHGSNFMVRLVLEEELSIKVLHHLLSLKVSENLVIYRPQPFLNKVPRLEGLMFLGFGPKDQENLGFWSSFES